MTSSCTRRRRASLDVVVPLGIMFTLTFAAAAHAQAVSNPRVAEFDPSPDHWNVLDTGQPAVVRYELGMYMLGESAPFATIEIGKPSPEADGRIRYDFSSTMTNWPLPGGDYEARVSAVGPEGGAVSDPSNPFTVGTASACTVALNSTTVPVPAAGGSYTVDVSTGTSCTWAATTTLSWVTLWTSGGSGIGTVPFAVQANTSSSSRTGTVMIGEQAVTLRQDGQPTSTPRKTPTVSWTTPAAITQGTPLGAAQLKATASVPGTFTYNPAAGSVLAAGTHTLRATFTPADATRYTTASRSTSLTVNPPTYRLTVSRPSGGTVSGAGIKCGTAGTTCQATMSGGLSLVLHAAPDAGFTFSAWTGHCSGISPDYTLQLSGAKSCGATFTAVTVRPPKTPSTPRVSSVPQAGDPALPLGGPYTLTVAPPAGGIVRAAGIYCGANAGPCAITMPAAMTIGLQATANPGYVFVGWTGHCSGPGPSHALALDGPRSCGASFASAGGATVAPAPSTETATPPTTSGSLLMGSPYTLTVTRPIGGTIQAAGINCGTKGTQCAVTMPAPLQLGLQATPEPGYRFTGWTSHCSGTQPGFSLALNGPRNCSATFAASR